GSRERRPCGILRAPLRIGILEMVRACPMLLRRGRRIRSTIELPLWLAAALMLLSAWAVLDLLLVPSVRWILRRRVNRVLDELDTRLKLRIPPCKLTKREVLIDRLLFDPQVQQAAESHARERDMPRDVAMAQTRPHARALVPAFHADVYFRLGYWLARN